MTLDSRLSLIAQTVKRMGGAKGIPDRLKPRLITEHITERHAVSQTAETVARASTNDSILDEEANVDLISPMLARCTGAEVESHARDERGFLLSPRERAQAADDLWNYRHPSSLWLAPVGLFASPVARLTA